MDTRHSGSSHYRAENTPLLPGQPNNNNQSYLCFSNWRIEFAAVTAYGADLGRSGGSGSPYWWLIDHSSRALFGSSWSSFWLFFDWAFCLFPCHYFRRVFFVLQRWSTGGREKWPLTTFSSTSPPALYNTKPSCFFCTNRRVEPPDDDG